MEERNEQHLSAGSISDALFGTSSDAIIEGLHEGVLTAQSVSDAPETGNIDDKNQIVNEQDQNSITNTVEDNAYTISSTDKPSHLVTDYTPPMSKTESETILAEDEHLDEAGDNEDGVSSRNIEKDKIN